ncbi:MAG TPA: ISL3 family transposase, partial [Chloroflexota bacterium]|nr:ISL3 family transposase [Chloroflexota bacterium]
PYREYIMTIGQSPYPFSIGSSRQSVELGKVVEGEAPVHLVALGSEEDTTLEVEQVQGNLIRIPLGLLEVRVLGQRELGDGGIAVRVVLRPEVRSCPNCGRVTGKVHDRREQAKGDVSLGSRRLVLMLVKRRFRCPFCDKVFTEPDEVCGWRRRLTKRFREELYQEARHSTVKRVAQSKQVSQDTVRRALVEVAVEDSAGADPVRRLGMDDFSVRKGQRYQTAFYDLYQRKVLEVVEGRTKEAVQKYLDSLVAPENVEAVTMDMNGTYRSAVQESLPKAEIVADKFHVIKRVNEQLDRLRTRLQGQGGSKDRLYKGRYLLMRNLEDLEEGQREKLRGLLRAYPELRRGWLLKEEFRRWYRPQKKAQARLELKAWMADVQEKGPAEFRELLSMLKSWKEEILNYFHLGLTNAFAEGKNTRTKQLQRQAYGYRNLNNLNLRILLPCA